VVGEHVRGETRFGVYDVLAQCSYEEEIGPYCCVMRQGGDILQQEVPDPCAGRAGEDGLLEGFWSDLASWASWGWVLVEP